MHRMDIDQIPREHQNLIAFTSKRKKVEAAIRVIKWEQRRRNELGSSLMSIRDKWAWCFHTDETMLYQYQNRNLGKVWSIETDAIRFASKPKHSDSKMLFGAFCLKLEFAWYDIFGKNDFVQFNTRNGEFDAQGNPRHLG